MTISDTIADLRRKCEDIQKTCREIARIAVETRERFPIRSFTPTERTLH